MNKSSQMLERIIIKRNYDLVKIQQQLTYIAVKELRAQTNRILKKINTKSKPN